MEGEHAPGVAQRAGFAVRRAHPVDAPLHVDLVEAESRGERARQRRAHVLPELPHRGQFGQRLRVPEQVPEGDQRVGRIRQRKELFRLLVHRAPPLPQRHFVEVRSELRKRKLAGTQLLLEADHFAPGLGLVAASHGSLIDRGQEPVFDTSPFGLVDEPLVLQMIQHRQTSHL